MEVSSGTNTGAPLPRGKKSFWERRSPRSVSQYTFAGSLQRQTGASRNA